MRAGPSTATMLEAMRVGAIVTVLRAGKEIATVPAKDVVLDYSGDRTVPAQLTYKAPAEWEPRHPLDPLNNFGQRTRVTMVYEDAQGNQTTVVLGVYQHSAWALDGDTVTVTALDLMQTLEENPMAWPSSPPLGATLSSELARLAGGLDVILDLGTGVTNVKVARTSQWGNSRTEAVAKLAASYGCGLRVSSDGRLHCYLLRDAEKIDLVVEAGGLLIDAPSAPVSADRIPNRWIVTGTKSGETTTDKNGKETTTPDVKYTAERRNVTSPFDPAGYGWVTSHQEFSAADSQAAVDAAVDTYQRTDMSALGARTLTMVPDARIEAGDILGVYPADGEPFAGRVTGYSLPVTDVDSTMRVDVDVLEY